MKPWDRSVNFSIFMSSPSGARSTPIPDRHLFDARRRLFSIWARRGRLASRPSDILGRAFTRGLRSLPWHEGEVKTLIESKISRRRMGPAGGAVQLLVAGLVLPGL